MIIHLFYNTECSYSAQKVSVFSDNNELNKIMHIQERVTVHLEKYRQLIYILTEVAKLA